MFLRDSYVKIIFLSLMSFCDCYRTFYFPPMCNFSRETTDCSFQFQSAFAGSCRVYNTNACKKYNFSSWNLATSSRVVSEVDSKFSVTIVPYAVYDPHPMGKDSEVVSAINITLASDSKDINGYSIVMTKDFPERNACRIFDYRESAVSMDIKLPHVFFYDCFHRLYEGNWENVSITFKAYPLNTELNYFVYIPPLPKNTSACEWKPLVMIFQGSLSKHNIHFKFSNAPEKWNITFFDVMLVDPVGAQVHQIRLYHDKSPMILGEFLGVATGYYSLHVSLSAKKSCTVYETAYFFVGGKTKDYSIAILTALLILLVISASLLIYFSGQWYIRKASPKSKPTLLFAYFHKSHLHNYMVLYSKYLESRYGVTANIIYARSGNPLIYLREKVAQSDVVVFVRNQNMKRLDGNDVGKGDHHWVNQLSEAISLVEDADVGSKRTCEVYFSESRIENRWKRARDERRLFVLPKDLDRFLCFVFKCPRKLRVLSKLFGKDHHRDPKSHVKIEEDDEMKRKFRVLMDGESQESPLPKAQGENKSLLESERVEQVIPEASSKVDKPPLSDNLLKESLQENLVMEEKADDSDDLRNDPMKYCLHKLLYSESGA